ncbi:MAG: hypothetical protein AAGN35_02920 [Bacteroidota bacterium]
MRNSFSILLAIFLAGTIIVGCKDKPVTTRTDLEAPQIFLSSPPVVPLGSYNEISSSDSFNIDVRFEDDIDLRDYEITIRYMPSLNYLRTTVDPWKETWFGSLDGTAGAVNFNSDVVFNPTAGPYEFRVKATDESGKSAEVVTYYFVINDDDPVAPNVLFNQPDTMMVDTFAIGQNIPIIAIASDPGGQIVNVFLRVRDAFTNEVLANSEINYDTLFVNPAVIDTFVTIGAGTVPGDYNVEVYADDPTSNVGSNTALIYIKPN